MPNPSADAKINLGFHSSPYREAILTSNPRGTTPPAPMATPMPALDLLMPEQYCTARVRMEIFDPLYSRQAAADLGLGLTA